MVIAIIIKIVMNWMGTQVSINKCMTLKMIVAQCKFIQKKKKTI